MEGPDIRSRRYNLNRLARLRAEQQSWVEHWRDLSDYILPRRSRFLYASYGSSASSTDSAASSGGGSYDRNKGWKKNQKIINGTATRAARTLASGMMAGITSPARPWFRLTVPDPSLAEADNVREWLHVVEERIRLAFDRSNVYQALHTVYGDLGTFGTAAPYLEDDGQSALRAYVFPIGQYMLGNSARQRVDTCYRQFGMTVGQLVEKFGRDKCSTRVRDLHQRQLYEEWIDVVHAIEPNTAKKPGQAGPAGMGWRSAWFELAANEEDGLLSTSGYEEFPVLACRWATTGEDVYGYCPGMSALGDVRALQQLEKRKGQVVEKIVNPPMRGPSSLLHQRASLLPGEITLYDATSPAAMFAPAHEIKAEAVSVLEGSIREHERRIDADYYADLWVSFLRGDASGPITAREVAERHEEKLLQLGPVLEQLDDELFDPLIYRTFGILWRRGELPPPPQEMQGHELRVEYTSIMAQAQKLLGTTGIERLAGFAGNIAAAKPDVLDNIDSDKVIREYADNLGVKPDLLRSEDEVQAIRQQRAQAQAQAQQAQQAATAVQGAKVLSETDLQGDNALKRLVDNVGGAAGAAARQP